MEQSSTFLFASLIYLRRIGLIPNGRIHQRYSININIGRVAFEFQQGNQMWG